MLFILRYSMARCVEPGAEYGVARHGELLHGILRERLAGLLLDQLLVIRDDGLQIFGSQVGVELGLDLFLAGSKT